MLASVITAGLLDNVRQPVLNFCLTFDLRRGICYHGLATCHGKIVGPRKSDMFAILFLKSNYAFCLAN